MRPPSGGLLHFCVCLAVCSLISADTDCRPWHFVLSCFGRLNIYMFLWLYNKRLHSMKLDDLQRFDAKPQINKTNR
ncbi:hypothetical protein OFO05_34035, partial [Escherichia coli]|nr:hypothetical protein [Escherichia coli]